jgi:hypothetical protein
VRFELVLVLGVRSNFEDDGQFAARNLVFLKFKINILCRDIFLLFGFDLDMIIYGVLAIA